MKYTINSHINFEIIISPMIKNFELIEIFISTLQEKDPDMISDSLDVLFILMKENNNDLTQFIIHKLDQTNGSKILENLQLHKNPKICEKAVKIIEILLKEAELENKI